MTRLFLISLLFTFLSLTLSQSTLPQSTDCSQYSSQCTQCSDFGCSACISGYGISSDETTCIMCATGCSACQFSRENCYICAAGYTFIGSTCASPEEITNNCAPDCNTCVNNICALCNSGTYLDSSSTTCIPCNPECQTCTYSASQCDSCSSGFYRDLLNDCTNCPSNCETCSMSDGFPPVPQCNNCINGWSLDNNSLCTVPV